MAGPVKGVGDQRAVPRPDVAVGVAGELGDVVVGGGNDSPAVVELGPDRQQAAPVEPAGGMAQPVVDRQLVLPRPDVPVVQGPGSVGRLLSLQDQVLAELGDPLEVVRHADPVADGRRPGRFQRTTVEADGGVDRPLLDAVAAELAVLGVDLGAEAAVALLAVGPGADAVACR